MLQPFENMYERICQNLNRMFKIPKRYIVYVVSEKVLWYSFVSLRSENVGTMQNSHHLHKDISRSCRYLFMTMFSTFVSTQMILTYLLTNLLLAVK